MKEVVTVVIPAKDEEKNLERLLPALNTQTVKPTVIVAIAPNTTDGSAKVCKKYGARVVKGGLPGPGRNAGAKLARTPFIVFLDADTKPVHDTFLEEGIKEMKRRKLDLACVQAKTEGIDFRGFVFFTILNNVLRIIRHFGAHFAVGWCIFIRRKAHEKIGGFDESVEFYEDTEYSSRAVRTGFRYGYMSRKNPLYVDTRRLHKDGLWYTLWRGMLVARHRRCVGEIYDLAEIDAEYFEFK